MAKHSVLARLTAIVLTAIAATPAAGAPASTHLEYTGAVISDASSDEAIVKGDEACYRNDFAAAMTFYRIAAGKSDSHVQAAAKNRIGILYERAFGVPQDYAEALKWFQQAAALGNGFAQGNIGDYYFYGIGRARSFSEALRWYRLAAEKNVPLGVNQVGWIYLHGLGVAQDAAEARRWYLKGVMLGSATSEVQLGWMYVHVAPIDYAQGMKWYRKAATRGDETARNNIGYLYENGLGVKVDYKAAAKWYSLSAAQGYSRAMFHLGSFFDKGLGVARDPTMAEQLMGQAAQGGDSDAQRWLAVHWSRRLAPWVLLGIALASVTGWMARSRVTRLPAGAAVRLHHPTYALITGLVAFVFFGSAAIISNVFPNQTTTWWTTTIFVGFAALSLPLLLDYFLTWYDVSEDGLDYGRPIGGRDYLKWALVRRVTYSRVMNWFRLETDSGRVARVRLRLIGMPEFARIVLRGVPSAAISARALPVLQATANGTPLIFGNINNSFLSQGASWAITRKMGMWRFVLKRGVLAWGLPMYLVMACLPVLNGRAEPTASYFSWQACLWGFAGAVFGLLTWLFYERSYRKQHGKQER